MASQPNKSRGGDSQYRTYGTYEQVLSHPGENVEPKSRGWTNTRIWSVLLALVVASPLAYLFLVYIPQLAPRHIPVPDLVLVRDIKQEYIPESADDGRLILIGDVHGMLDPLKKLFEDIDYDRKKDHVVFLGDFISKGEDSMKVLDMAMDMGASCVRGNHEDEILGIYTDMYNLPQPKDFKPTFQSKSSDDLDKKIAASLTPDHIQYISTCPAILKLGNITDDGVQAVACHGGLQWNVPNLTDQDAQVVMTIRTLLPPNLQTPTEGKDGEPWADKWNVEQHKLDKADRNVVFYGHDAHLGLNLQQYTKGLDSGCVKGRKLSSIVISRDSHGKYKNKLHQVSC